MDEFQSVQATPQVQFNQKNFFGGIFGKSALFILGSLLSISIIILVLNYFRVNPLLRKAGNIRQPVAAIEVEAVKNPIPINREIKLYQKSQSLVDSLLKPDYGTKINLEAFKYTVDNETSATPIFISSWEAHSIPVRLSAHYNFNKNSVENIDISIQMPKNGYPVYSGSVVEMLSPYLQLSSETKFDCTNDNKAGSITCNTMLTQADESRIGISYVANISLTQVEDVISICQRFPGSNSYKWNSCLNP